MKRRSGLAVAGIAGLAAISMAFAPSSRTQPEMTPPPGMTPEMMEMMQACQEAGTPGEQHKMLAKGVGVWTGTNKMWMSPDGPAMESEITSTCTMVMDGRYFKCEVKGAIPDMGEFHGVGIYAFDNVSQKFQCTWIDNMSTGIMTGEGASSSDGKTMTWTSKYNCPVTKKPTTFREVQRWTGKDTMVMEMHGTDPISGKEYKMMEMSLKRKPGTEHAGAGTR